MTYYWWADPGMQLVLTIRLLGPLLILRWPLAGSLLSEFVFDASDVIIWDAFHSLQWIDYTHWDKPLDMYMMAIQAIVVWRWRAPLPRQVAGGLLALRVAGFIGYELTHIRSLFMFFPNIFGNYFLGYLICAKLGRARWFEHSKYLVAVLAIVWLTKLPQEYLLHYKLVHPWTLLKGAIGLGA